MIPKYREELENNENYKNLFMTTMDLPNENWQKKKQLLTVDLYAQVLIILVSGILFFMDPFLGLGGIYLVLGGYQLISSLIHLSFKPISGLRKAYYPQLVIHLIALGIGIGGGLIVVLYAELFLTLITAVYYIVITVSEYIEFNKK